MAASVLWRAAGSTLARSRVGLCEQRAGFGIVDKHGDAVAGDRNEPLACGRLKRRGRFPQFAKKTKDAGDIANPRPLNRPLKTMSGYDQVERRAVLSAPAGAHMLADANPCVLRRVLVEQGGPCPGAKGEPAHDLQAVPAPRAGGQVRVQQGVAGEAAHAGHGAGLRLGVAHAPVGQGAGGIQAQRAALAGEPQNHLATDPTRMTLGRRLGIDRVILGAAFIGSPAPGREPLRGRRSCNGAPAR